MTVLIKGTEMPDIGNNKSIKAEIRNLDGKLEFGIMTGGYHCSQQWTYYPLVSVPSPHGDLIDRDEAHKSLLNGMVMTGYQSRALDCISSLRVPTIIEAEEE